MFEFEFDHISEIRKFVDFTRQAIANVEPTSCDK